MEAKINPYDWINPVIERGLFAGREEELGVIKDEVMRLSAGKPIVPVIGLLGERRVGKSSLVLRVEEMCEELSIVAISVCVESTLAGDIWEFWHETISRILIKAHEEKISIPYDREGEFGFLAHLDKKNEHEYKAAIKELWFPNAYVLNMSKRTARVPGYIIEHDIKGINDAFLEAGYKGSILILDEAQLLIDSEEIKQQLLHTIQHDKRSGLVFAGQSPMGRMFSDDSEPFFNQAKVIPVKNFTDLDDVAECALLPLSLDERKLMSPMTIDYIAKLSQGKPNLIRLICCGMYNRYLKEGQKDLNININVLDDVLDCVAQSYEDPELRGRIDKIERLNSVDFEILYNMTRYPNWNIEEIVVLDESFRGEKKSGLSMQRRRNILQDKKDIFIKLGILNDETDKCVLSGGEFIALYVRFLHEVLNYGKLSRKLIVGKGPATPFGEKADKLVRAFAYSLGQGPELRRFIFHSYARDYGDVIARIKKRYVALAEIMEGKKPANKYEIEILSECFDVCELISKDGEFFLVCLTLRNLEQPRELIQVELYFDLEHEITMDLGSLFGILNQQSEDARVLIEGYDYYWIKLPNLEGLLNAMGGATLKDLKGKLPMVERWRLDSIQHYIDATNEELKREKEKEEEEEKTEEEERKSWVDLYGKGGEEEAEDLINKKLEGLGEKGERQKRAKLFNDRGYIRYGDKSKKRELARRDLETALDLHYSSLTLTLSDLSIIDIDENNFKNAIEKIEATLLLTLNREALRVDYLRLRLPENHLGFRVKWEQHPANVIEASYINLAYALLKLEGYHKALDVINEGLELMPSSTRLNHAMARTHLFNKRADLTYPIYRELAEMEKLPDAGISVELRMLGRRVRPKVERKTRKKS